MSITEMESNIAIIMADPEMQRNPIYDDPSVRLAEAGIHVQEIDVYNARTAEASIAISEIQIGDSEIV